MYQKRSSSVCRCCKVDIRNLGDEARDRGLHDERKTCYFYISTLAPILTLGGRWTWSHPKTFGLSSLGLSRGNVVRSERDLYYGRHGVGRFFDLKKVGRQGELMQASMEGFVLELGPRCTSGPQFR